MLRLILLSKRGMATVYNLVPCFRGSNYIFTSQFSRQYKIHILSAMYRL